MNGNWLSAQKTEPTSSFALTSPLDSLPRWSHYIPSRWGLIKCEDWISIEMQLWYNICSLSLSFWGKNFEGRQTTLLRFPKVVDSNQPSSSSSSLALIKIEGQFSTFYWKDAEFPWLKFVYLGRICRIVCLFAVRLVLLLLAFFWIKLFNWI